MIGFADGEGVGSGVGLGVGPSVVVVEVEVAVEVVVEVVVVVVVVVFTTQKGMSGPAVVVHIHGHCVLTRAKTLGRSPMLHPS